MILSSTSVQALVLIKFSKGNKAIINYLVIILVDFIDQVRLSNLNILHKSQKELDFCVEIFFINFIIIHAKVSQEFKAMLEYFGNDTFFIKFCYFLQNVNIILEHVHDKLISQQLSENSQKNTLYLLCIHIFHHKLSVHFHFLLLLNAHRHLHIPQGNSEHEFIKIFNLLN